MNRMTKQASFSAFTQRRLLAVVALAVASSSLIACGGTSHSAASGSGSGSGSSSRSSGGAGSSSGTGSSGEAPSFTFSKISGGTSGLSNPLDVAVDGSGNVWVTDYSGGYGQAGGGSVTELTKASDFSAGSAINISGVSTGLNGSKFLAIDPSGNVWITSSFGSNSVTELTKASGYAASSAVVISGGNTNFNGPCGILADESGNIWVANIVGNSVTELPASAVQASNATGVSIAVAARNISGGSTGFASPAMVAMDPSGNLWITNVALLSDSGSPGVTQLTKASNYSASSAVNISTASASGGSSGGTLPFDIASDSAGNIWMTAERVSPATNSSGTATMNAVVVELTLASNYSWAQAVSITGFASETDIPLGIAIDGAGNVWFTNLEAAFDTSASQVQSTSSFVTELTKASNYSASSAVTITASQAGFTTAVGIAIDGSGNVWIANSSIGLVNSQVAASSGGTSNVVEIPGAASPTSPPLL